MAEELTKDRSYSILSKIQEKILVVFFITSGSINAPASQGVNFPVHYVNKYNAYYDGGWKNGYP